MIENEHVFNRLIHTELYKTAENKMNLCSMNISRVDHYIHGLHVMHTAVILIRWGCARGRGP